MCIWLINDFNDKIRGNGVEKDAGGDEKQLSLLALDLTDFDCTSTEVL